MSASSPLPRRTVLRGAGAVLGLPLLEAMLPRRAAAQAIPPRFVAVFHNSGTVLNEFFPAQTGAGFTLPRILEPLADVRDYVMPLSSMRLAPAGAQIPETHNNQRSMLTSAFAAKPGVTDSIDQVIAANIGAKTRFGTLQMTIEQNTFYDPSRDDNHDGYKDSPTNSFDDTKDYCSNELCRIAYAKGAPVPNFYNPRLVFEKLFGAGTAGAPAGMPAATADDTSAARRRIALRKSILDFVQDDVGRLQKTLGAADDARLDQYLTGLRKLEQSLPAIDAKTGAVTAPVASAGCTPGVKPLGIPVDPGKNAQLMCDLMVKAFQCDATRVATLMLGENQSQMPFQFNGLTYRHHLDASHYNQSQKPNAKESKIFFDRWQVGHLAYLMKLMKSVSEPGGTMLDNVVIYYSSEVDDSQGHGALNMPTLLAGRGGGKLKPGRHLAFPGRFVGEIFVTILNEVYGVPAATFGEWGAKAIAGLT